MTRRTRARRQRGNGSILERADGRFEARYVFTDGGRRVRRSIYAKTREEADAALKRALVDVLDHKQPPKAITVGRLAAEWLEAKERTKRRPSTLRRYEQITRVHVVPNIGRVPVTKLTAHDVEVMLDRAVKSGLSHQSASHVRAVVRSMLNRAVRQGIIGRNVAADAEWAQPPREEAEYLTPEQVQTLFASIDGDPLAPAIIVATFTGARQGELLGLTWRDIDFEGRTIAIRHAVQWISTPNDGKREREWRLVPTKTEKSRRVIPMSKTAGDALRAQKVAQAQQRLVAGRRWADHGFVFTGPHGNPLDGTNVTKRFQRLLKLAGLPRRRWHSLRHTAAVLLLKQNVPPRVVMELLGHSTISLTMNTYSHVLDSMMREAADELDRALGG